MPNADIARLIGSSSCDAFHFRHAGLDSLPLQFFIVIYRCKYVHDVDVDSVTLVQACS
jgi:hypothetical protein